MPRSSTCSDPLQNLSTRPVCAQVTYERVCDLRERRQEQEDLGSDCAKAAEVLRKEREQHSRKAKLVEQSMAAIDQVGARSLAGGDAAAVCYGDGENGAQQEH